MQAQAQAEVQDQEQAHPGVEEVTVGVEKLTVDVVNNNNATPNENYKKNRIQVSNTKKPLFFYVNLAKRYLQQHDEVELSALGMGWWEYFSSSKVFNLPFHSYISYCYSCYCCRNTKEQWSGH